MPFLTQEGNFQVTVIQTGVKETPSGATGVEILFKVDRNWDRASSQWSDQWPNGHEVRGTFWFVKKDGTHNTETIARVAEALGWNSGNIEDFQSERFDGVQCCVTVKSELYEGKTYYKASWIDPLDKTPGGGVAHTEDARLKALQKAHGAVFKALTKGVQERTKVAVVAGSVAADTDTPADDIPF